MRTFTNILVFIVMLGFMLGTGFSQEQQWLEADKVDQALKFNGKLCEAYYGVGITVNRYTGKLIVNEWKKVSEVPSIDCYSKLRLMNLPSEALDDDMKDNVLWLADQTEYFKHIYAIKPFKMESYKEKESYEETVTKWKWITKKREVTGRLLTVVDERKPTIVKVEKPGKEDWKIVQVQNDKEDKKVTKKWRYRTRR